MMKKNWIFIGLLFFMFSCSSEKDNQVAKIDKYYNLLDLLDEQVNLLTEQNAKLEKTLGVGTDTEVILKTPSKNEWKSELDLFYSANINKLGLLDAYEIEALSRVGGGTKLINVAKSKEQSIRLIEYNFADDKLEYLRILVEEVNDIYVYKKEMQMTFIQIEDELLLKSYSIKGTQTMIMKSDLNFSLDAKVIYNPALNIQ